MDDAQEKYRVQSAFATALPGELALPEKLFPCRRAWLETLARHHWGKLKMYPQVKFIPGSKNYFPASTGHF